MATQSNMAKGTIVCEKSKEKRGGHPGFSVDDECFIPIVISSIIINSMMLIISFDSCLWGY